MSVNFSKNIKKDKPLNGVQVFSIQTGVSNFVTISGSFLGGSNYSPRNNFMLAGIVAQMLDEGTLRHTKDVIRERLDTLGATVSFSCSSERIKFSARCLTEHIPEVVRLIAEQLRYPKFAAKELALVKEQLRGRLEQNEENTRSQAKDELTRKLHNPLHPNYIYSDAACKKFVKNTTRSDVVKYYAQTFGLGSLVIVVVGDVNRKKFLQAIKLNFRGWKEQPKLSLSARWNKKSVIESHSYVTIPDKESVDFVVGGHLGITKKHPDFHAVLAGLQILGGGTSGRLFQQVREKRGLSYGAYTFLSGMEYDSDGYWYGWAPFAPKVLKSGRKVMREEIEKFIQKGISQDELNLVKEKLVGSYLIGLSTTSGIAGAIEMTIAEQLPLTDIDDFPKKVQNLKKNDVNQAINMYFNPKTLVEVGAGSVTKKGNPL